MKKALMLTLVLLLGAAVAWAQETSNSSSSAGMGQNSATGQNMSSDHTVRGCLSGSQDNYTLTDQNGNIYELQGQSSALQAEVGHEIEVTGSAGDSAPASTDNGAANPQNYLRVSNLHEISSTCSHVGRSNGSDTSPMNEKPPVPHRLPEEPTTPPPPQTIAMLQQSQQPASPDAGSAAAQNSNSSSSMSTTNTSTSQSSRSVDSAPQQPISNDATIPATGKTSASGTEVPQSSTNSTGQNTPPVNTTPPVTSQTPAQPNSPTSGNSQLGTSPANNTGMTAGEANRNAQAARQGELNANPQTGDTTGRGVNNQGVNNPSQTSPNAVPTSPNSASPQAGSGQNKPLYERQATDVPWASSSSTAGNGNGNTTTTSTTTTTQQQQTTRPPQQ